MKIFILLFGIVLLQVLQIANGFDARNRQPNGAGSGPNTNGDRGSWGVSVNKDKGRGPQVRTEGSGNIYSSRDGNWRVDAHGHHEMGRGRKPDFGGGVSVTGRWRREAEDNVFNDEEVDQQERVREERSLRPGQDRGRDIIKEHILINRPSPTIPDRDDIFRGKRSLAPGGTSFPSGSQQSDRGTWGVTVNKDKGRGPQVRTEAQGNIYKSPSGNVRVDGQGHHEFGKGRKPDYGGRVKASGRWRRDVAEGELTENADEAQESQRLDEVRQRREARPQKDRGSVSVSVNKDQGRGPQVRTDGQYNIHKSKNWEVNSHGYHEFGKGRKPSYGGGISVTGRFRRDVDEVAEDEVEGEVRERREARAQKDPRGSVSVSVNKDQGRGPQFRTDGQYTIHKSKNWEVNGHGYHEAGSGRKPSYGGGIDGQYTIHKGKNWEVNGHGYHEVGNGRKPSYGGGLSVTGRFRRDVDDIEEEGQEGEVRERREARAQKDPRGSVSVSVNKDQGRGPQIRTDGQYNIHKSKNWEVNSHGYHEAGRGRKPSYGGGISVTRRFRREIEENEEEEV